MIFNFFKKEKPHEPGKLLFDYYDGQSGLPMEPGYKKIALTATENPDKLRMDVYTRPTGDGEVESKTTYLVSARVFDDAMKQVKKHKLVYWNKRRYPCMCGRIMACKFIWNGELVRVSSENMPDNGRAAFDDIYFALYAYADPALIFEEPDK